MLSKSSMSFLLLLIVLSCAIIDAKNQNHSALYDKKKKTILEQYPGIKEEPEQDQEDKIELDAFAQGGFFRKRK